MEERERASSRLRTLHTSAERQAPCSLLQNSRLAACRLLPQQRRNPARREDLAYQALTVVAILLVLCSVWVF